MITYIIESMYNTHSCSYTCIMNLKCSFVILVLHRRSVPTTKWRGDKMTGSKVSSRRHGWRLSVPATKWLATKRRRQHGGDEGGIPPSYGVGALTNFIQATYGSALEFCSSFVQATHGSTYELCLDYCGITHGSSL